MIKNLDSLIAEIRSQSKRENLPLSEIRVIDMSTVIAAPYAATLLADYGAEVIKIENPSRPDAIRGWGVLEDTNIQPFWSVVGRNKYPVTLNLKESEGRELILKLIQQSDVLIENMRPGSLEKLGIGRDRLMEENPGLIIGTVSGYGNTGPYAERPGFGTLAEGFSGYTYLNTRPQEEPVNAPLALADFITGTHLAFGIMVALQHQKRGMTGGQVIDISLYEPLFSMLSPDFLSYSLTGEVPQPKGNELSYIVPRNNYRTKDDKWVALSCSAEKPYERLMNCIGRKDMIDDQRFNNNKERIKEANRRIVNEVISDWISKRNLNEVIAICEETGITVGPIATMEDIARDAHYLQRQSIVRVDDPATGIELKLPNVPFRMSPDSGKVRFPGLPHGSANQIIYSELLGLTSEEIRELKYKNII